MSRRSRRRHNPAAPHVPAEPHNLSAPAADPSAAPPYADPAASHLNPSAAADPSAAPPYADPADPHAPHADPHAQGPVIPDSGAHAKGGTASAFFGFLLVAVIVAVLVVVFVIRSDDDFEGNLESFCALLDPDTLAGQLNGQPNYDALAGVAPKEIRPAVLKLQDTSKDIAVLEQGEDLAAYFAAAFDRDAIQARRDLDSFIFHPDPTGCGIEIPQATMRADIEAFMNQRFGNASWLSSAQLELITFNGVLHGLTVDLRSGAGTTAGEAAALEACAAYDEYLRSRLAPGVLTVRYREAGVTAEISAPDRNTACG